MGVEPIPQVFETCALPTELDHRAIRRLLHAAYANLIANITKASAPERTHEPQPLRAVGKRIPLDAIQFMERGETFQIWLKNNPLQKQKSPETFRCDPGFPE